MADYRSKEKEKGKLIAYHSDSSDEDKDDNDSDKEESVLSLSLEKVNLGTKKKKLLVFNLSGVLVHRDYYKSPSTYKYPPDAVFGSQLVYKRPFLEKFMKFCHQRFEVGIWSSAQVQNTDGVIESVLQEFESRFLFVWDQDHCSDYGYKLPDKKRKPMFFKELTKLWSSLAKNSVLNRRFYESNTLLIDNEPYKALLNPVKKKKKFSKYENKDEEFWTYDYGDYKEEEYDDDEEFSMYCYNDDDDEEEEESLGLEKLKLVSRKKLLVFNLNGLLIHRDHKKSPFTKYRSPGGAYGFKAGSYSSGYDQKYCSDYGYKLPGKKKKPMFFKELSRLWSFLEYQFYESNTLLIDNEPYKALLNPPNTGIFLDTYDVKTAADNGLDLKNEVRLFLEGLAEMSDCGCLHIAALNYL